MEIQIWGGENAVSRDVYFRVPRRGWPLAAELPGTTLLELLNCITSYFKLPPIYLESKLSFGTGQKI
jgi:hypothetical protein